MFGVKAFLASVRAGAKLLAEKFAKSSNPTTGSLRVNPIAALRPRRRGLTGNELAWVRTRKNNGLSRRAGRSKYDPPELRAAIQGARLRFALSGVNP